MAPRKGRKAAPPRLPDWEARLHALIAKNAARPHVYGPWDCLLGLSAETIKALTGVDHGKHHRGKYRSPASASRYLRSIGFDSPEALLDSLLETKPIGFAQRGDLVLVPADDGGWPVPAVCMGDHALFIGMEGGFGRVPRAAWLKAWAVGDSLMAVPSTPTGDRP